MIQNNNCSNFVNIGSDRDKHQYDAFSRILKFGPYKIITIMPEIMDGLPKTDRVTEILSQRNISD